jgi:hypothetical protein
MVKIKNQDQLRRTVAALVETRWLIDKERAYRQDLQKADYLASLVAHEAKLEQMIKDFFPLPIIEPK